MRILSLATLILIIFTASYGQTTDDFRADANQPDITFSGKVTEIEDELHYSNGEISEDRLFIKIDAFLKNTGDIPVIFLQIDSGSFASVWAAYNEKSFYAPVVFGGEITSSTAIKQSDWKEYKRRLDTPFPSKGIVRILQPGEIYDFKDEIILQLPRQPQNNISFLDLNVNLETMKQRSPVFLKLEKNTWDQTPVLISENKSSRDVKLDFLEKLHERWAKKGYLWLDNIISEPVVLDLKSTPITRFRDFK